MNDNLTILAPFGAVGELDVRKRFNALHIVQRMFSVEYADEIRGQLLLDDVVVATSYPSVIVYGRDPSDPRVIATITTSFPPVELPRQTYGFRYVGRIGETWHAATLGGFAEKVEL